jgi:glycosyltransferase involved in cell wall biosynthesis
MDYFLFPSLFEWFWIVLIEAMSHWIPAISFDCNYWPREILAPELNIRNTIEYPYISKYWILTDLNFNSFYESTLKVLNRSIIFEKNIIKERKNYFRKNNIFSLWENLVNDIKKA